MFDDSNPSPLTGSIEQANRDGTVHHARVVLFAYRWTAAGPLKLVAPVCVARHVVRCAAGCGGVRRCAAGRSDEHGTRRDSGVVVWDAGDGRR